MKKDEVSEKTNSLALDQRKSKSNIRHTLNRALLNHPIVSGGVTTQAHSHIPLVKISIFDR